MGTDIKSATEPGLAETLRRGLDPNELVHCYQVTWSENGQWRTSRFAVSGDALDFTLTLPRGSNPIVIGSTAERRMVNPPMGPQSEATADK